MCRSLRNVIRSDTSNMTTKQFALTLTLLAAIALVARASLIISSSGVDPDAPVDRASVDLLKLDPRQLYELAPAADAIKLFQERVGQSPDSFIDRTTLSRLYLRQTREAGDTTYLEDAETAVSEALLLKPDYLSGNVTYAAVLSAQHRFSEALDCRPILHCCDDWPDPA